MLQQIQSVVVRTLNRVVDNDQGTEIYSSPLYCYMRDIFWENTSKTEVHNKDQYRLSLQKTSMHKYMHIQPSKVDTLAMYLTCAYVTMTALATCI